MPDSTKERHPVPHKSGEKVDPAVQHTALRCDPSVAGGPTKIQVDEDGELLDEDAAQYLPSPPAPPPDAK